MKNDPSRIEELLNQLLELKSDQRDAFLQGACNNDPELRKQLETLLEAHLDADGFLTQTSPASGHSPAEAPGTRIGRYKLLQRVGEGGMGVVYMAEQEEPVRRRVALKIIKLGMDTRQVVARFEAERQALAMMEHPNIAKVLDGGATETGRPYFVMELVQGVPITDFCDKTKLKAEERLKLFIQVCQAVQHAHQKGIIHRDLKPSNVLVTLHDGVPVPKVIDFGIAKAMNQKLTEKTLFTNFATMIGTPAYMSPEQAEMSGLDVDTRTDIYALGVLLYQLLTGTTPFPEKRLRSLGYGEMQRVILEEEPERPSTRLSTMANEQKTLIARNCCEELADLSKRLRGDLDWIVMKCLEKDRQRRYDTATSLAGDIQRHLSNEPVIARPPSAAYRFRKMARRNRGVVAGTAAVAAVLLLGAIVSTWQAIRASRAERQQHAFREEAESARRAETTQRAIAEQRVYDSLVREARALRLARRVGYRDRVFSLLQQAAAIEGVQKDMGELRREAVACLGDFVGRTPVDYTNWPPGFLIFGAHIAPGGNMAVFRLGHRTARKDMLIVREIPGGRELFQYASERSMHRVVFSGANGLVLLSIPYSDDATRNALAEATVTLWSRGADESWHEHSPEKIPGAYDCLATPDRTLLLIDDWTNGIVNVMDLGTRTTLQRIPASRSGKWPPAAVLTLDGRFLAVQTAASPDDLAPEVAIYDLTEKKETLRRALDPSEILQGLSSDGKHLLTFNDANSGVTVYETASLRPLYKVPNTVVDREGGLRTIPGHNIVALPTYMTREVRLVDYLRQEVVATLNEPRNPHMVCFSGDGRSMLSVGVFYARLYHLADEPARRHLEGRPEAETVALHPEKSRVAVLGKDGVLTMLAMPRGNPIWQRAGYNDMGLNLSNGEYLTAVGSRTQEAFLLDWNTGERLLTVGTNAKGFTHDFQLSSDGRYLLSSSSGATGGGDVEPLFSDDPTLGQVSVWELNTPKDRSGKLTARKVNGLVGKYCSVVFLGRSTKVAFMDYRLDPSVYVWDIVATNSPTRLPLKPRWSFGNLASSPDGSRLWTIDEDGSLVCVDAVTGARLITSREGLDRMDMFGAAGLSISPDGTKLAVNSTADRGLEIFETAAGRLLYHLPSPANIAASFMWASSSRQIFLNTWDADVSIWDLSEVESTLERLGLSALPQTSKIGSDQKIR